MSLWYRTRSNNNHIFNICFAYTAHSLNNCFPLPIHCNGRSIKLFMHLSVHATIAIWIYGQFGCICLCSPHSNVLALCFSHLELIVYSRNAVVVLLSLRHVTNATSRQGRQNTVYTLYSPTKW